MNFFSNAPWKRKKAVADAESLRRVFSTPENKNSTLSLIEKEISQNLQGFLNQHIVSEDAQPAELETDFLDSKIPDDPMFVSEQANFLLSKVVSQSVHTASPSFIGHMTSALPYFMLPLAKIMMGLNQNLVKIETSKAFTPLERQVIGMMHRLIYQREEAFYQKNIQHRQHGLGVFCSGGTIANISALWVARNQLFPQSKTFGGVGREGMFAALRAVDAEGAAIFVSQRGHYSLKKAADVLGIGQQNLVCVETDAQNKIKVSALRAAIEKSRKARMLPLAIVGIAGTTETGNVDPLSDLGKIALDYQCHFHVDAAWGGPTLFSEKYAHLLTGINQADSVSIDAHKQLYVPVGAGIVLFKSLTALNSIEHHANYIIREGSRDLGKHTLEGTRPGTALLVHSGLRIIGRKGYELLINSGIERAQEFAHMILARKNFELVSEPELNLLTYRYVPAAMLSVLRDKTQSPQELRKINVLLNELTITIQKKQRAAGKTFVSRTKLKPEHYARQEIDVFRVVLANPLTDTKILEQVLIEQEQIAQRLIEDDFFTKTAQNLLTNKAHS